VDELLADVPIQRHEGWVVAQERDDGGNEAKLWLSGVELPPVDGRDARPNLSGNELLQKAEVEPPSTYVVPKRPQLSGILLSALASSSQGDMAERERRYEVA
jgi:hypothetical protein